MRYMQNQVPCKSLGALQVLIQKINQSPLFLKSCIPHLSCFPENYLQGTQCPSILSCPLPRLTTGNRHWWNLEMTVLQRPRCQKFGPKLGTCWNMGTFNSRRDVQSEVSRDHETEASSHFSHLPAVRWAGKLHHMLAHGCAATGPEKQAPS